MVLIKSIHHMETKGSYQESTSYEPSVPVGRGIHVVPKSWSWSAKKIFLRSILDMLFIRALLVCYLLVVWHFLPPTGLRFLLSCNFCLPFGFTVYSSVYQCLFLCVLLHISQSTFKVYSVLIIMTVLYWYTFDRKLRKAFLCLQY